MTKQHGHRWMRVVNDCWQSHCKHTTIYCQLSAVTFCYCEATKHHQLLNSLNLIQMVSLVNNGPPSQTKYKQYNLTLWHYLCLFLLSYLLLDPNMHYHVMHIRMNICKYTSKSNWQSVYVQFICSVCNATCTSIYVIFTHIRTTESFSATFCQ